MEDLPDPVSYVSVDALDSTHFVVAWRNDNASPYPGSAIVGTVSGGNTISYPGADTVFNFASTNYTSVAALDSNKFVVAYQDNGNSDKCTGIIGDVSGGNSISFNSEEICKDDPVSYVAATPLSTSSFAVAWRNDNAAPYPGSAIVGLDSAGGAVPEFSDYVLIGTVILAIGLMFKFVPKINPKMRGA